MQTAVRESAMMISRVDCGPIANWWWTIDRFILTACLLLMSIGILVSFAASPSITQRIGITDCFHFAKQHIEYTIAAFFVMMFVSFFAQRGIRYACYILFIISVVLLLLTVYGGVEIKGSRRWISLAGFTVQPSEFIKPAITVILAWLFTMQGRSRNNLKYYMFAIAFYVICSTLMIFEPDVGQIFLISITGVALFILSGVSWVVILPLIGFTIAGAASFYWLFDHVRERVNGFLMGEGDTFQVDAGREAIIHGSWFGRGPVEGTVKRIIPDSHTDFVFSVVAEEYGIVLCMMIVSLFAFIVLRSLIIAMREHTGFIRLSVSGIATLFGFQSIINMAVNLHLIPPKGMTLPFISYGGSSLISVAFTMGCLLSLTRRRPETRMSTSNLMTL